MNGYERYMGVLTDRKVDILPRLPILMAFATEFIGSNYAAFASDYRILTDSIYRCAEYFGFDQLTTFSDPYRETQGFGAAIEYVTDGVPRCPTPPLKEIKNLNLLTKPNPLISERMLDRIMAVEHYKKLAYKKYSILGWVEGPAAEAADLRGVENFLIDLIDDPEFLGELMDLCVETAIPFARVQLESGADTIGIGDAIASQVSLPLYQELIFPKEKTLVQAIHNAGGYVRLHICGNISHLLPEIAKLKVDILDVDWQVDMAKARDILGSQTVLMGNLDPANDVMRGTPESIKEKLIQIYRTIGNRYMTGAGCEIPPGTAYENLKALCVPIDFK
ncbi:MAG: uroporphyrinogen decarboxylase family protein [Phycisphaerae bacterium]